MALGGGGGSALGFTPLQLLGWRRGRRNFPPAHHPSAACFQRQRSLCNERCPSLPPPRTWGSAGSSQPPSSEDEAYGYGGPGEQGGCRDPAGQQFTITITSWSINPVLCSLQGTLLKHPDLQWGEEGWKPQAPASRSPRQ